MKVEQSHRFARPKQAAVMRLKALAWQLFTYLQIRAIIIMDKYTI